MPTSRRRRIMRFSTRTASAKGLAPFSAGNASRRGVALVLILFAVLFVSFMVVLFLSLASRDRTGTTAYADSLRAEELATGGLELVVQELRKEIADPNRSTVNAPTSGDGPTVYVPKEAAFVVPQRTVEDSRKNLLKVSKESVPLFDGATALASKAPTTTASRNGRSVSLDRWRKPGLAAFDEADSTPDWIYFNRKGPIANPNLASASDPKSAELVTGRIAFAIYDVGGTLDLNVAGYPAELPAADAGKKGSVALARLQALGLTDAQVEKLIAFRNPGTRSDYASHLADSENHKGFTATVPGDNRFLSRQELIRFAEQEGFADKLYLMGMFSREKNAPSYAPDPALPTQTADPTINGNLATARHSATGRLLFETRFPLSKIALLADPSGNAAEIKKYFGLEYNSTTRTYSYVGSDSSIRSSIKTLSQIGAEPNYRKPDFFETLKAVIYSGSVGQSAGETASSPVQEGKDFQIIRIGACIVDQYDADFIPTAIALSPSPGGIPIWGVENLPYVNKLQFIGANPNPGGIFNESNTATRNNHASGSLDYYFRWAVELWNPHVQKLPMRSAPDPDYIPDPRIKVALGPQGALARVDISADPTNPYGAEKKMGTEGSLSSATSSNEFNIATGYAQRTPTIASYYRYFMDPRQVFFGEINTGPIPNPGKRYYSAVLNILTPIFVDLYVYGPDGFLHHYFRSWEIGNIPLTMTTNVDRSSSYFLSDPRTNRMGHFDADFRVPTAGTTIPAYPHATSVGDRYAWPIRISPSLDPNQSVKSSGAVPVDEGYTGSGVYPALLFENTVSATQFRDPDGVTRIGDGGFFPSGNSQVPMAQLNPNTLANPPASASNPSRPRILNRPFRSIADLGYVFRDGAWKSLNFSSTDSADSAILDAFSLHDESKNAGKTSLSSPHIEIWESLLGKSIRMENDNASGLTEIQAKALAEKIVAYLSSETTPPGNITDLVTKFSTPTNLDGQGFGSIANRANKSQREAAIRALSESVQSRTWNIMIDLIAQTGRFSKNSTSLDSFMVEGERRTWLHLAVDRFTGEILDEQIEIVVE